MTKSESAIYFYCALAAITGAVIWVSFFSWTAIAVKPAPSTNQTSAALQANLLHTWRRGPTTVLGDEIDWVCASSGRVDDAQVTHLTKKVMTENLDPHASDNQPYSLWMRGANYGDYSTSEDAVKAAARYFAANGWTCP